MQSDTFRSNLPHELQLSILTTLSIQLSSETSSNPHTRYLGPSAATRELVRLRRVSRGWHNLVIDGQLWSSFDSTHFFSAYDPHTGLGLKLDSAIRILSGPAAPFLRHLNLTGLTQITDHDLDSIIDACLVTDSDTHKTNLITLNLTGCRGLSCRVVDRLVGFSPQLKRLTLRGLSALQASTLSLIADLSEIESVDLGTCNGLVISLEHITGAWLHSVCELRLTGVVGASDALLSAFSGLVHLQRLDLSHCAWVSDTGMRGFVAGRPATGLEVVNLAGCTRLTDAGLGTWADAVPLLHSLDLSDIGPSLRDPGLIQLLTTTPRLQKLDLGDACHLTDAIVSCLLGGPEPGARACLPLESLCLSHVAQLSERSLLLLVLGFRHLKTLILDHTRATDRVVRAFLDQDRRPGSHLSVIDCRRVTERVLIDVAPLIRLRHGQSGYWARGLESVGENGLRSAHAILREVGDDSDETKVVFHSYHSWLMLDQRERERKLNANLGHRRRISDVLRVMGRGTSTEAQLVGNDAPPSTFPKRSMSCLMM